MVFKKRGFIITIIIVLIIASLNLFLFFKERDTYNSVFSGRVTEKISENFNLNLPLLAFIAQWIILLIIIFTAGMRFLKHKKQEEIAIKEAYPLLKKEKKKPETDLDLLYGLLKEKKELSTGTISKLFKISKEKALEWGKILEDHELVIIEYPTFDDPEIRINVKSIEEREKTEKEKKLPENLKSLKETTQKPSSKIPKDSKELQQKQNISKTLLPAKSEKSKTAPKSRAKKKSRIRKKSKKKK